MDQQRMEEDGVALLHLQVHPGVLRVVATHSVVHLVNATLETRETVFMCVYLLAGIMIVLEDFVCVCSYLPLGVVMLLQGAGVCSRQDDQAAVLPVHFLHCSPGADDPVDWAEREVMQILMHRVTGCLLT